MRRSDRTPRRSPTLFTAALALATLATLATAGASGCTKPVECSSEIATGSGAYKGKAQGPGEDAASVRRESVKDACARMCQETKALEFNSCRARCVADAEAGKVGAKITCTGDG